MRPFVLDVKARLDPIRDHVRAVSVRRRRGAWGDPSGEQEPDAVGTTQAEIVQNHRFEEVTAVDRTVEDLRETDFELTQRDAMIKTRGPILRPHRPGEAVRPAIEEGLNVGGTERVTRRLQGAGIGTRE